MHARTTHRYRVFRFRSVASLRRRAIEALLGDDDGVPSRARYLPFLRVELYGAIPVLPGVGASSSPSSASAAEERTAAVGHKRRREEA